MMIGLGSDKKLQATYSHFHILSGIELLETIIETYPNPWDQYLVSIIFLTAATNVCEGAVFVQSLARSNH